MDNNNNNVDIKELYRMMQTMNGTLTDLIQQETKKVKPFSQLMEDWFAMKHETLNPNTYDLYRIQYRCHIEPAFRGMMVHEVTADRIQTLVAMWKKAGLSPSSMRCLRSSLLFPAFKRAMREGLIDINPVALVETPKQENVHVKRALTLAEVKALEQVADKHYLWIAVPLLVYTGMRKGEMLALTWKDIDFSRQCIHVTKSYSATHTQGNKLGAPKNKYSIRDIIVPPVLLELLKQYKATVGKGRLFVIGQKRADKMLAPSAFYRTFLSWCHKAGIPEDADITVHSTRHTYVSYALARGADRTGIIRQLGHNSPRMIDSVYGHKIDDAPQKLVANLMNFSLN